jgi:WD40-like Beta Propeller Repeat
MHVLLALERWKSRGRPAGLAALAAAFLVACGGGGGGDTSGDGVVASPNGGGSVSTFKSYRDTNLPGHLLVNAPNGRALVYNLADGSNVALPASGSSSDGDQWDASTTGLWVTRLNRADFRSRIPVDLFSVASLGGARAQALLPDANISNAGVRPSPDGRYLLAFRGDARRLTVFDANTGAVVEQGSFLDGNTILSFPAAWLPNGDYVYLVGQVLYATTPGSPDTRRLATLALPPSDAAGNHRAGGSEISVNPAGTQLAFTWSTPRLVSQDNHVWVVNLDGSGLRRVTEVPDPSSALDFGYGSPTWSPDGQWLAMVLYMNAANVAPAFPLEDPYTALQVIGTTGCDNSPVMVVAASAQNVAMSWPRIDPALGVKVRAGSANALQWVSTCSSIRWLP